MSAASARVSATQSPGVSDLNDKSSRSRDSGSVIPDMTSGKLQGGTGTSESLAARERLLG
jgi:hypothetical protein